MRIAPAHLQPRPSRHAFTLVELLVVISIIGVLAGLLLPSLSQAKARARTIQCLNNLKQLQVCWHSYSHDNEDIIPPNNFVYTVSPGTTNDATLGEDSLTWCRGIAPFDTNEITAGVSLLFNYNQSAALYHCPADFSTISGFPTMLRKRSYNMSNSCNCNADDHFHKAGEIRRPDQLFTFIDTDADEIWDSTFGVLPLNSAYQDYWLDIPADRHQMGANLSFADGHAQRFKWQAPKSGRIPGSRNSGPADLKDLRRMQQLIKGANGN
jgi:prepilin-type N-terminal cleavage/methylation domain-containing protein/prepilin-type processing-associated H-X9-DG protein